MSNPLPFELKIDSLDLIAEMENVESSQKGEILLKLYNLNSTNNERTLILSPRLKDFKVTMGFTYENLDKFKLIGKISKISKNQNLNL